MRVMVTTDAVGGVWRYSADLACGLTDAGAEVIVAVLGPPAGPDQLAEVAHPAIRVLDTGLPLDWTAPAPDVLRETASALAGLAQRLRVQSVHLHTPALAPDAPWAMPVVAAAHSCVGTWWQAVRGGAMPEDLAWRAAAVGRGLAEADVAVAPSRAFAHMLQRLYRPGRPIRVIHNGTAPRHADCGIERESAVLCAGRLWDDAKNIVALDRVAERCGLPVVAAGPLAGPNGERFVARDLHVCGKLASGDLHALMDRLAVFAAPARYEPFGLAVLEAARAGMALALADIPSFRELWDGAALFFHPDDDDGLCAVLRELLNDPAPHARRARVRAAAYPLSATIAATLSLHGIGQPVLAS